MNKQARLFSKILLRAMVIILCLMPLGCAVKSSPVFIKDGKEYGRIEGIWGGNFWNYYERAISYADGECWPLAINDFQQAIRLKSQDQRRVRTYGLHIIDDYFPHREIGIAYYAANDYQRAIKELSSSLGYYPSAKAKYYLNLARKAYLKQTLQDITPPEILITSHHDQQLVGGFEAVIEGEARDDCFVEKISINGTPYPCELSQKDMPFKTTLALGEGINEIKVAAVDLSGKESAASLRLIADRQAPLLYIDDLRIIHQGDDHPDAAEDIRAEYIQIEGYVVDNPAGPKSFQIDRQAVSLLNQEGRFMFRRTLTEPVGYLPFAAEDRLGNRVEGQIRLEEYLAESCAPDQPIRAAAAQPIRVAALQLAGLSGQDRDTRPPTIRLDTPYGNMTVDWETLFISGEAHDGGGIQDLLVNDESILPREGKKVYFNHTLKLRPGENTVTIKAIDPSGNETTKTIKIERKISPVYEIASRMSMAIIPFAYQGEGGHQREGGNRLEGGPDFMADYLINAFVSQKRFCMIDRERIDRILRRLQPGESEGQSPLEIGHLVSAESVLAGRIYENKGFVEIVARLIDTETSVILDSQDVYGQAEDLKSVKTLLEGLALKFKYSFPLAEGVIVEREGQSIVVNIGKDKNIRKYTKYIIFRDGKSIRDPSTQKVLEYRPQILGEAKISQVFEQISEADLIHKDQQGTIRVKDRVITK